MPPSRSSKIFCQGFVKSSAVLHRIHAAFNGNAHSVRAFRMRCNLHAKLMRTVAYGTCLLQISSSTRLGSPFSSASITPPVTQILMKSAPAAWCASTSARSSAGSEAVSANVPSPCPPGTVMAVAGAIHPWPDLLTSAHSVADAQVRAAEIAHRAQRCDAGIQLSEHVGRQPWHPAPCGRAGYVQISAPLFASRRPLALCWAFRCRKDVRAC